MRFSHRLILLWLAHAKLAKKKTGATRKHSRCRKDFFRSLSIEERRQRYALSKNPTMCFDTAEAVSLAETA